MTNPTTPVSVVFACVANAGRSQMAAAFFNQLVDSQRAHATSAGTRPAAAVHPEVVIVMQEVGIDLSHAEPRYLTTELASTAYLLVTMGCGEECPLVPGVERDDWALEDPKGQLLPKVREIRNEIKKRVDALLKERHWD